MIKTFFNLIQDVQKTGRCHHCGGCITFCSAINYGALELDDTGKPCFGEIEKCIECGLCYSICPETDELNMDIREKNGWEPPYGKTIGTSILKARDETIREQGTDGGVVTAVLTWLFDSGRIDGAIVSKNTDQGRAPFLATSRQDLIESGGSCFHNSHGMVQLADAYDTFSPSIEALARIRREGVGRLALVGTPCQINTIRKMQALDIVPSDTISYCFGLFCSGQFMFDSRSFARIESRYKFRYADVEKINIKENFIFRLSSGRSVEIPVDQLDDVKREACGFCSDFSAQFADVSFGGLGSEQGWTTVITRTPLGREVIDRALGKVLDAWSYKKGVKAITHAENKINAACAGKTLCAENHLEQNTLGRIRIVS